MDTVRKPGTANAQIDHRGGVYRGLERTLWEDSAAQDTGKPAGQGMSRLGMTEASCGTD